LQPSRPRRSHGPTARTVCKLAHPQRRGFFIDADGLGKPEDGKPKDGKPLDTGEYDRITESNHKMMEKWDKDKLEEEATLKLAPAILGTVCEAINKLGVATELELLPPNEAVIRLTCAGRRPVVIKAHFWYTSCAFNMFGEHYDAKAFAVLRSLQNGLKSDSIQLSAVAEIIAAKA
jgi:hypothetical protein